MINECNSQETKALIKKCYNNVYNEIKDYSSDITLIVAISFGIMAIVLASIACGMYHAVIQESNRINLYYNRQVNQPNQPNQVQSNL